VNLYAATTINWQLEEDSYLGGTLTQWCKIRRYGPSCLQNLKEEEMEREPIFEADFTMDHIRQFVDLSVPLQDFNLQEEEEDDISWNLAENGKYSSRSAY
jgi:hypothetical protein